ncbi:MAG: hypothetical protein Alpg2KO_20550 [Alphaproteobacteria bacterium]
MARAMTVAFDNTFLTLLLNPRASVRPNPSTGQPVSYCQERIEALIDQLQNTGDRIIIPTPCLSEVLVAVADLEKAVSELKSMTAFELASFDARCAIDLAEVTRSAIASGDKRAGIKEDWQHVKIDRQIVMISKVYGARTFYTDDSSQSRFAEEIGLEVKHTWDLELPDDAAQISMQGIKDDQSEED